MAESAAAHGIDHAMRRFEEVDREYGWSGDAVAAVTFLLAILFREHGVAVVLAGALPAASHLIRRTMIRASRATFQWAQVNTLVGGAAVCAGSLGTGGLWSPVLMFAPLVGVIATIVYPHQDRWVWLAPGIVAIVAAVSVLTQPVADPSWFAAACSVIVAVAIPRYVRDFVAVEIRQRDHATIDSLTGCLNRSTLADRFVEISHAASDNGSAVGVAMFDIDHFKRINDEFGHDIGDEVLRSLSRTIRANLGDSALFFRLGGEEFLVLDRVDGPAGARLFGEHLRNAVETEEFVCGSITVSVGTTVADRAQSLKEALLRADHAMLEAKRTGRNRTESAPLLA